MKAIRLSVLGTAVGLWGCGSDVDAIAVDAHQSALAEVESELDENFTVRPDFRKCVSPLCGGWFVRAVNKRRTTCADGTTAPECYVAEIDLDGLGLSTEQLAELRAAMAESDVLLRGSIGPREYPGFGNLGMLGVSEANLAVTEQDPRGRYFRVTLTGIRCFTHPCPTFEAELLNSSASTLLAELNLASTGASQRQIDEAMERVADPDGLLVAGTFFPVTGPAGRMRGLRASQMYFPVEPQDASCVVTGCSGQVCAPDEVFTTCEWRPEYACYRSATCEIQPDGACGWTPTEELLECLGSAGPAKCDPSLICAQVITCVDGLLYPTACGPRNCDTPIGKCDD